MDLQELTKKNQEFVHIATHQLIVDGKSDQEVKDILENVLPDILENQKKGVTARSLLGAPTAWAASFTKTAAEKEAEAAEKNTNPWLMFLDTSLLFIAIISFFNGITLLFNNSAVTSGLLSLLVLGFSGGAAMYATYYFVYRHMGEDKTQRPGWIKTFLILLAVMLAWIILYTSTAFIPTTINIQIPAWAHLLIAAIAITIRTVLKKKYNTLSSLSPK